MFTTKELKQLLFALSVREDRFTTRKSLDDPEDEESQAYWDEVLRTVAIAKHKIECELADRDSSELHKINAHFRAKRAKALILFEQKKAAKLLKRKPPKSEPPLPVI